MAAPQSHLPCAVPGLLLLLLIGATVNQLPQVHARPADFWCNHSIRQGLMASFEDKGNCKEVLSSPVPVPCVGLNLVEWENKTLEEKRAEVLGNFQVFQDAVQHVRNQTSSDCHTFLETFEHNILQYVKIVSRVHRQNNGFAPSQAQTRTCAGKNKLSEVWNTYTRLIRGKLRQLVEDTGCNPRGKKGA